MRRRFRSSSEVAGSANKSRSKVVEPKAIDKDACRKRIFPARDGFRQSESSAAFGKWFSLFTSEDFQELFWNFLAFVNRIAAFKDARIFLHGSIFQDDRVR